MGLRNKSNHPLKRKGQITMSNYDFSDTNLKFPENPAGATVEGSGTPCAATAIFCDCTGGWGCSGGACTVPCVDSCAMSSCQADQCDTGCSTGLFQRIAG